MGLFDGCRFRVVVDEDLPSRRVQLVELPGADGQKKAQAAAATSTRVMGINRKMMP